MDCARNSWVGWLGICGLEILSGASYAVELLGLYVFIDGMSSFKEAIASFLSTYTSPSCISVTADAFFVFFIRTGASS